jgi:hypothetical protein
MCASGPSSWPCVTERLAPGGMLPDNNDVAGGSAEHVWEVFACTSLASLRGRLALLQLSLSSRFNRVFPSGRRSAWAQHVLFWRSFFTSSCWPVWPASKAAAGSQLPKGQSPYPRSRTAAWSKRADGSANLQTVTSGHGHGGCRAGSRLAVECFRYVASKSAVAGWTVP